MRTASSAYNDGFVCISLRKLTMPWKLSWLKKSYLAKRKKVNSCFSIIPIYFIVVFC